MKWIKRLLLLLAGLLLSSVLIVAGTVLLVGESNYKRLLGWGAEHFLDSQLVIDGPIQIDLSRNLLLTSADILLKANDDSYRLSIGKLHANFRLGSYLRTGTFWFNNLELEDINLEVLETADDDDFSFEDLKIPPVLFDQAQFNNVEFTYQELPPGTLHTFLLDELTIGELGEHQPLSLRATGQFEGQPFKLQGTSDSIARFFEHQDPFTLQLELSSAHVNAKLQGTIAEPFNGRGMDLQLHADIPQLRDIIEIVWDEFPILGSLQGSLKLHGDFTAPRLEAIDIHLQRGQEVDLKVRGSVADVLSGAGLDLQLDGKSSNPEVLSWLLFKKHDRMQTLQVSGKLQGDIEQFSLHDLDAFAETADEVKLQINGNTIVHPEGYRLTQADAGLTVEFSAPSTEAANLLGLEDIPELGPISGSLALALGMDAVAIYSADIDIGNHKQSQILLKGDVGYVQLVEEVPNLSELKLQTEVQTTELAHLGKQLDYPLPALGPVQLRGLLVTQGSELLLQAAKLDIGIQGQSTLHATGLLATQLRDPANFRIAMDMDIQATELARLGKQLDYALPALGPARLRGKLVTQGSELLLQAAKLDIGTQGQSTLHATGLLATQLRDPENFRIAMDVDIQATELARLAEPFGYKLPELGQTQITGWLESKNSEFLFNNVTLVVGAADQPTIRANGTVTTQLHKGSSLNVEYDLAVAPLIATFSDMKPKNLGRLQGDAVISDLDGEWSVESLSVASTQTGLYQLHLDGSGDLQKFDEANINTSLAIDSPPKLGEALGIDLSGLSSFRQQGLLSMKKGRLHFDGKTSLGATHSTIKISGHFKDGKPVLSGSLDVPAMHLADFGLGSSPASVSSALDKDKPSRRYVFSREKLNLAFLNEFDFDFTVSINEVENKELRIESISGQLQLHDGHLSVTPMQLVFEGGNTNINLEIKTGEVPHYQLSMIADDLTLGPLMAQVQKEVPIQGYSNIHLDLRAQGHSPHEIASSLSGNINLGLENARIPKHIVDKLSIDVFNWVLNKSPTSDKYTNLNCLIMIFAADQGELKSETIIADGPQLSIGGRIDMDLGEETLDIVLIPKQKKKIFSSVAPVKVHGPMLDPKVSALPVKAALKQVGTVTMLSTGIIIPVYAAEKLWSLLGDRDKQGGGCDTINKVLEAEKKKKQEQK